MEQMRRGKADTQTSDAKFDEQFQLGHRMQSKVINFDVRHVAENTSTLCPSYLLRTGQI